MKYRKYGEYQDSGSKWLGDIPTGWQLYSGKRVFSNRREKAKDTDEQLAASQKHGVIPQKLMMELNDAKVMLAIKGTESFRHVEKNDFVISLRSFEGGIEFSDYQGCVSPAYTVLKPQKEIDSGFYRYLLKSKPFIVALQSTTDSLRDGKSISYEQFGNIAIVLPPQNDQSKIASFLDRETGKIDTLIARQQQLIGLLQEKRQAVISHAVTKGLNPNTKMKPTGIQWLGEVPEHWKITQIKHVVRTMGGGTPSKDNMAYWEGNIPWVSPKDMKVDYISDSIDKISDMALRETTLRLAPIQSVLIVVRGMILLHSVPVSLTQAAVTINQDMKALIPYNILNGEFLLYLLKGVRDFVLDLVDSSAHGTKCLRTDLFDKMTIALPDVEEQLLIIKYLKLKLSMIDSLVEKANNAIVLLQERRTALISAAVTGKIDVRQAGD